MKSADVDDDDDKNSLEEILFLLPLLTVHSTSISGGPYGVGRQIVNQ